MESIKKSRGDQIAKSSRDSTKVEGESLLDPSAAENPEVLDCNTLSGRQVSMTAKNRNRRNGSNRAFETKNNESPVAGQGICLGPGHHDSVEGIGVVSLKTGPTAVGVSTDWSKQVEAGSAQKVSDDDSKANCMVSSESELKVDYGLLRAIAATTERMSLIPSDTGKATSVTRLRYRVKQEAIDQEPNVNFDPPSWDSTLYDSTSRTVKGTQGSQINHISFKTPMVKIIAAESLGFSFNPRVGEGLSSSRAPSPGSTLSPFEDIGKQGKYLLPNHQRSANGSRHHSRGNTLVLQDFGPIAMKMSKETGDHPPKLQTPPGTPYISCNIETLYGSTENNEGMGATRTTRYNAPIRGRTYMESKRGDADDLGFNLGPYNTELNIECLDILFSPGYLTNSCGGSSAGTKGKGPFDTSPISVKHLSCTGETDFTTLGSESTYMSSRNDCAETTGDDEGGNNALRTYHTDNADASPLNDRSQELGSILTHGGSRS